MDDYTISEQGNDKESKDPIGIPRYINLLKQSLQQAVVDSHKTESTPYQSNDFNKYEDHIQLDLINILTKNGNTSTSDIWSNVIFIDHNGKSVLDGSITGILNSISNCHFNGVTVIQISTDKVGKNPHTNIDMTIGET